MLNLLAAQDFHEIAPPVDYSFVPTWLIFVSSFVLLSIVGWVVWLLKRKKVPPLPPKLPREIALEDLDAVSGEIKTMNPSLFSLMVANVLRLHVTYQYGRP